ncbi:MAG TPA: peptidyl-prolyl cis-trans isomerase, partial [Thermoanaerobaculia bacterium]|nr:peptidyl-prolyl cis-trans isomerase [Thermoanaerobaculia bacterium]
MKRLLAALPLAALLASTTAAQTLLIDRVVLRVNDRIATMVDFQRRLGDRKQAILNEPNMGDRQRQEMMTGSGQVVLADIYQELLLLSRADQLGVRITEPEVDKAVAQARERMSLKTDDEYKQALAAAGLTDDMLRGQLRRSLAVQEVMGREVQPRLRVDDDELRRYYREHPTEFTQAAAVRLQDVVVLEEDHTPEQVADTARQIHDQLSGGADMTEVAKRGAAAGSTTPVVDLGWVQAGDLDPDLEKAAWDLPPGGVTAPVRGKGGLHVVKLTERRAAALRPFDDVKEQVAGKIEQSRMAAEFKKYLRELEERSYIALKVPPEAEGFKGLSSVVEDEEVPGTGTGLGEVPAPTAAAPAPAAVAPS